MQNYHHKNSLLDPLVLRVKKDPGADRAANAKPLSPSGALEEPSQAALRVLKMRYRRLFDTAREGVLLLDPDTRKITDANPFIIECLGSPRREVVGKELWEIGLLKDQRASREMFRELQKKHFIRYEDLALPSATGPAREVEVVANLFQDERRPVIQCNILDVTERKRAEQQLAAAQNEIRRHAAEMQQRVAERTAQLRETIGELEAFSYSVSHDMRSPLSVVRGFAEILLENYSAQLDGEGVKYLEKIGSAAKRMDTLIQEVLTYTHVLRAEVKIESVDLDALVRQVIDAYPQLRTGNVEIQIEGALPKVLGGEASLAQCLSNLLTNAVKFVEPGAKARVKIWAQFVAPDVRLWVEDNGIGIDPIDQVRIFKMFERVGRVPAYEGTGLGLAIVRKAVERMGGRMGVESEIGRGSKFWIQLKGVSE